MKANRLILWGFLGFFLWGCGKGDPQVHTGEKNVRLLVFGAHWCGTCSAELPKLQEELKARLGDQASRVNVELWVPTGKTPASRPTQAVAEEYREKVGLDASVHVDEWHWKQFKKLFPGVTPALPAGVLLTTEGTTLREFPPGETTFVPSEIVSEVAKQLQ